MNMNIKQIILYGFNVIYVRHHVSNDINFTLSPCDETHTKLQTRGISMRLQDAFDMLMWELHIRIINDINKKCISLKSKVRTINIDYIAHENILISG